MYKCYKSEIKDLDDKTGIITVAANAFGNVDSDDDISMEGSYTKTIKENFNRLRWFYNHDKTILLGVPLEAKEMYPHLQVRGQINLKKEIGRDVYEDYKLYAEHGKTLEHSVGVNPVKRDTVDKRKVLEWKWWEYSTLSSWGANENTPMLDIKSLSDAREAIEWLETKLRKGNYTDERFSKIEQQLTNLKTLCTEPVITTQQVEPSNSGLLDVFKNYTNNLNSVYK
jgi:HK97 family phage prohead protease